MVQYPETNFFKFRTGNGIHASLLASKRLSTGKLGGYLCKQDGENGV